MWEHDFDPETDPRLAELDAPDRAVAKLMAQGLTNREVGDTLSLAQQNIDRRVRRILEALRHPAPTAPPGRYSKPRPEGPERDP
jgi:DNA-binding NarL/FixJ family response regulator